ARAGSRVHLPRPQRRACPTFRCTAATWPATASWRSGAGLAAIGCAAVLGNPTNAFGVPQFRPYSPIVPALCAVAATALGLVSAAALGARLSGHDLQYRARPAEPAADPDQRTPLAGPQPPAVAQPRQSGELVARAQVPDAARPLPGGPLRRYPERTEEAGLHPAPAEVRQHEQVDRGRVEVRLGERGLDDLGLSGLHPAQRVRGADGAQERPRGVPDVERAAQPQRRRAERVVAAVHLLQFGVATDDDA